MLKQKLLQEDNNNNQKGKPHIAQMYVVYFHGIREASCLEFAAESEEKSALLMSVVQCISQK